MSISARSGIAATTHPQPLYNSLVMRILESPLRGLLSRSLAVVRYRGHRTRLNHAFPVQYARAGDHFVVLAGNAPRKLWWRNFVRVEPVELVVARRTIPASGVVVAAGDLDYDRLAAAYTRRFPGAVRTLAREAGVFVRIEPLKL